MLFYFYRLLDINKDRIISWRNQVMFLNAVLITRSCERETKSAFHFTHMRTLRNYDCVPKFTASAENL